MTESMLVTAQLAYVYPKLAELADLRGDRPFAAELRAGAARTCATLRARVDREGLVLARLRGRRADRHRRDLRGAAAVGDPRRRADADAGARRWSRTSAASSTASARRRRARRSAPRRSPSRNDPGVHRARPVAHAVALLPEPPGERSPSLAEQRRRSGRRRLVRRERLAHVGATATLDGVVPGARDARLGRVHAQHAGAPRDGVPRPLGRGRSRSTTSATRYYASRPGAVRQRPVARPTTARSPSSRRGW